MSYKTIQLSKAADIIIGFPFASEKFNINAQGIRLVRGKNITTGNLRWGDDTRWWDDSSIDLSKYMLKADDIVIGMDGSLVGKNYAKISENDLPLLLVQRVACIRAKEGYDQRFLWGCIASGKFEIYIDSIKTGTSIPHISGGQIGNYLIPDFDLPTQKKIAAILSALDEKIAINREINDNLEQQVSALYQSWFEDFEPSNGICPEHWSYQELSTIANIVSGKRPPIKSEVCNQETSIPIVGAASIMGFTSQSNHTDKILVTGRVGTHGVVQRFNVPCWTSDNTLVITSPFYEFTNQILCRIDYSSMNRGSTQPLITQGDMKKVSVLLPDVETLAKFETFAGTMMNQWEANKQENVKLAFLRDTLLPKLMSGEIDVSAVQL